VYSINLTFQSKRKHVICDVAIGNKVQWLQLLYVEKSPYFSDCDCHNYLLTLELLIRCHKYV